MSEMDRFTHQNLLDLARTLGLSVDDPDDPDFVAITAVANVRILRLTAERQRLRHAVAELVRLKDGPRDAAYEEAKPLAWEEARRLIKEEP